MLIPRTKFAMVFCALMSVSVYAEPTVLITPCIDNTSLPCASGIRDFEINGLNYELTFVTGSINSVYGEDFTTPLQYPFSLYSEIELVLLGVEHYGLLGIGNVSPLGSEVFFPRDREINSAGVEVWRGAEFGCNVNINPCTDYDTFGEFIDIPSDFDISAAYFSDRIFSWGVFKLQTIIDIKPGSDPNSINLKSKGKIPVVILTTEDFYAQLVDPMTVRFGPGEATESHNRWHVKDVDKDGDFDLLFHFNTQETGIQCGDTEATLTGETFSGEAITGASTIVTINCD